MSLRMTLAAMVGIVALAFNPHLVTGLKDTLVAPFAAWSKNPDQLPGGKVLKSPKFPENGHRRAVPKTIAQPKPEQVPTGDAEKISIPGLKKGKRGEKSSDPGFGAGAVAVQKARGLK